MSSGLLAATTFILIFSTRSSSTQPPDTDPTIWPSPRIATTPPAGGGAEPQVLTIVPSATRCPLLRQPSAVLRTSISTLSMRQAIHVEMLAQLGTRGRLRRRCAH